MSGPIPCRPLTYLEDNAARRARAPAIYEAGETMDFARLLATVRSLMAALGDLGVRRGDVVAVSLPNVSTYVALEIAVPAVGAILMPLPPALGIYEVESALRRSGAAVVVVDTESRQVVEQATVRLAAVRRLVELDSPLPDGTSGATEIEPYPTGPDDIVQIALTSGTTGPPKLASLSAGLKQLTFEGFTSRLGIGPLDRVLPLSPISQGVGEMCVYALRCGACLVMARERRFSPEESLKLAERSGATLVAGVPTMIRRLFRHPAFEATDLSAARATAVAGAPMSPELAQGWEERTGSRVCGFYGAMDIGQLAVASPDDPPEKRWQTVGRAHERAELMVCDSLGQALETPRHGELCMRGPLVQERYWGEEFGPFSDDGWAHFGDLGYVDEEGYVHVIGRTKDIIIRGGDNINPYEVEAVLAEHPGVAEVCLIGLPDADLGERPVAFVVARAGAHVSLDALRSFLENRGLARYKWPERLVAISELPLGSSGKVARQELRSRAADELVARTVPTEKGC